MYKINIDEEVETHQEIIYLLEEIIRLIDKGYTGGYYPNWDIEKN